MKNERERDSVWEKYRQINGMWPDKIRKGSIQQSNYKLVILLAYLLNLFTGMSSTFNSNFVCIIPFHFTQVTIGLIYLGDKNLPKTRVLQYFICQVEFILPSKNGKTSMFQ